MAISILLSIFCESTPNNFVFEQHETVLAYSEAEFQSVISGLDEDNVVENTEKRCFYESAEWEESDPSRITEGK